MFINLAVHSHYSLLMSSISIDDIINHARVNKQKHAALIDINNMYGAMEFYQKATINDLIPIIGLQITYQNTKVILIAKNADGYHNLVKLSSCIMTNTPYDVNTYVPNTYVIVEDIQSAKWLKTHKEVYSLNLKADNPIALQECFFENKADVKYLKALMAIGSDQRLSAFDNYHEYDDKYMLSEEQAKHKFSQQALKNLEHVINTCTWTLRTTRDINFIKYDSTTPSYLLLQTKCRDGLKQRLNSTSAPIAYIERLKKELAVIDQMHFNDYFLVVQDYVNFAKRNGILVGPGRGSAAGSLVAYVLGITDIDPIEHNLIFERFLNPSRQTLPDIDIDFMDNRRNEIVEYLFNRYGSDHVAHIITFQKIKAKMAIRDAGRVLGIELPIINSISKLINMQYDLDLAGAIADNKTLSSFANKYEELFDIAKKILNFPRQVGLHAAGVIITNTAINEVIPVQNSPDGINATQYSMEYLEPLGLIKIDILGLVNLTTINETIKLIKKEQSKIIDLSKIDLDDRKVFAQLTNGNTIGIFQLESQGMRNLIMKIKPTSIEDISITSALFRPGPQKNIPEYLSNKAHPENIKYLNDDFKEVLSATYNIIIYQEQVIEIVQRVAGFSLAEADLFRRAISKKDSDKLTELRVHFIAGGRKNKYSEEELVKIFNFVYEFANYGFNHSHSLAYSYISYWMAYLKTHYPLEYFTILLSNSANSVDKISLYAQEARVLGINITPPSINHSQSDFTIQKKSIIFGFNSIKGIGNETINKILEVRQSMPQQKFLNFNQAIGKLCNASVGAKATEILVRAGAFDDLLEDKSRCFLLQNLNEIYQKATTITTTGEFIIKPILKDVTVTDAIKKELSDEQFQLLGVSFAKHPLTSIKQKYKGEYQIENLSTPITTNVIHSLVVLLSHRIIKTKTGQAMAFAKIEDDTKVIDVAIFPGVFEKIKNILVNNQLYVVTIRANERGYQALSFKEYHHE